MWMSESEIRALVTEAVQEARAFSPGNVCDEAIVQRVMRDEFQSGWQSMRFPDEKTGRPSAD